MTGPLCIITDCHLIPNDPETWKRFQKLLNELPRPCTLITLGDFFDFWFRPVADHQKDFGGLIDSVKEASVELDIKFLIGNRDFLFKKSDAKILGIELVEEPYRLEFDNEKLCFMHGDSLLTSDIKYQDFRVFIRRSWVSFLSRNLPYFISSMIVDRLRNSLGQEKSVKPLDKFEVDLKEAKRQLKEDDLLICGHTHIPQEKDLSSGRLRVLPAFGDKGEYFYKEIGSDWELKQIT